MSDSFVSSVKAPHFSLWDKMKSKRMPFSFELEVTARCNNDCRHCYINLPAGDRSAQDEELSLSEISRIADEAMSVGAVWCLISGGEPLLRKDFTEIYMALKRKGLLLALFTNATLITEEHVALFKRYPPHDIEVTVYGATRETYERVTRRPRSFAAYRRGLDLLLDNGIPVRLKAMALRSNAHELPEIARFCRERTKDYFRFDPFLHLRFDGDTGRNEEIRSERLSPEEVVVLERSDAERYKSLEDSCDQLIVPEFSQITSDQLFRCGAGTGNFAVSYSGLFRLCSSLWHPDCMYDLRTGSVSDAWQHFVPRVLGMRSDRREFLETCQKCPIINLCRWCPAHAFLETGELDGDTPYFCAVAHARAGMLQEGDRRPEAAPAERPEA